MEIVPEIVLRKEACPLARIQFAANLMIVSTTANNKLCIKSIYIYSKIWTHCCTSLQIEKSDHSYLLLTAFFY